MDDAQSGRLGSLVRDVLSFLLKLMLDAMRDVALFPLTLGAGLLDLALIRKQSPRYFRAVLELAKRSEAWFDAWGAAVYQRYGPPQQKVDALLVHLEAIVRDPRTGAHKARVLRRWLEMQQSRRRRSAASDEAGPLP